MSELPGPKGLPLLGNLLQLDLKQLHRVLERWGNEFGTLYKFELGQRPVVVVTEPGLNQRILRDRPKLYRRLCAGFDVSKTAPPQTVGEIFSFTMMPENLFERFKRPTD